MSTDREWYETRLSSWMTKESRWSNEKIIYGFVVSLKAEYDHVQLGTQIWNKRCTQNNKHTNKTLRAGMYPILIHRGQLQSTCNFYFLHTIAVLSSTSNTAFLKVSCVTHNSFYNTVR
jgi:hypothetical protein